MSLRWLRGNKPASDLVLTAAPLQATAMSDPLHGSTLSLEALADEIRSQSKRRDSEHFHASSYPGLRTATNRRRKYRGGEYVREKGQSVRLLSLDEICELRSLVMRQRERA